MSASRALLQKLRPAETALFVCDIQEKFRPSIQYFPQIVEVARRLAAGAHILDMQIVATEQYPKGLGKTVSELELDKYGVQPVDKSKFSMCIPPIEQQLKPSVKSILICGIEAHVCVYQSVLDFLAKDYQVHVVVDATSSRALPDRFYAFKQMERAGAVLTTSECVLLGLVGGSDHPKFKQVQGLIKESAPDSGLL
ncbi:UNVERIFIED_CONTAM: Isochorismatase domain-containing protein 1, partial [Eudyptes robustus]